MNEVKAKFRKKYHECPAKEPELHSEGKGAICYFEKFVFYICCTLIIVIGTEATTIIKTKVVLSSWNLQCRGKRRQQARALERVSSTVPAGKETLSLPR